MSPTGSAKRLDDTRSSFDPAADWSASVKFTTQSEANIENQSINNRLSQSRNGSTMFIVSLQNNIKRKQNMGNTVKILIEAHWHKHLTLTPCNAWYTDNS